MLNPQQKPVRVEDRTDAELLAACADNDRDAFGALFDRHKRVVFATAFTVHPHRQDAEELLSDTFLLLWRKRASLEVYGASIRPWLLTTVRYLALNRRRASSTDVSFDDALGGGTSPDVQLLAEQKELALQLDKFIENLPPLDRQIVRFCLVEQLSYEQAAVRMGVTHSVVRNRLSRSKQNLRRQIDPQGDLA